ncbi:MAG: hypothetical protein K2N43_01000 [Lachnospiraceae bacterium]|nr:hypothetical protein [Lachnospiraceae bacterium]
MKGKISDINRPEKAAVLSALALCLFLFSVVRCGLYGERNRALTEENEKLSAMLTETGQAVTEMTQEAEYLQEQLAETASLKQTVTPTGFKQKGGVYLIDEESQLYTLRYLLAECAEIAPGVPAASASYRLRQDLNLNRHPGYENLFCLGTEEAPFCGSFDGDGHSITGYFPLINDDNVNVPEAIFHTDSTAQIENLSVINQTDELSETGVHPGVSEPWQFKELAQHLPDFPGCSVQLEINSWDLDTQRMAEVLRKHWNANTGQDGFFVSMTFRGDAIEDEETPTDKAMYTQKIQSALCTLAGEEYTKIIEEILAQEEGYLWFIRLEQVGKLTCCTFEIGEPAFHPATYRDPVVSYYMIAEGMQEGKEIPIQYFRIPYTDSEMHSIGVALNFKIENIDLDFDGKEDLLIHEGYSGGSGGSWDNYRALVWKEHAGQFAYFPSFPAQVYKLEFDRQRIVDRWRVGAGEEYVFIFEIVNGEYVCTKYLLTTESWHSEDDTKITLSYYEMGELVETHVLSDIDERKTLYPDMDYWPNRD